MLLRERSTRNTKSIGVSRLTLVCRPRGRPHQSCHLQPHKAQSFSSKHAAAADSKVELNWADVRCHANKISQRTNLKVPPKILRMNDRLGPVQRPQWPNGLSQEPGLWGLWAQDGRAQAQVGRKGHRRTFARSELLRTCYRYQVGTARPKARSDRTKWCVWSLEVVCVEPGGVQPSVSRSSCAVSAPVCSAAPCREKF